MLLCFQILAIAGSAAFAGFMLAIGTILGAFWQSLPPAEFLVWFQAHSHRIMGAVPLVVLPTIAGLAGVLAFSWAQPMTRLWWLCALGWLAAALVLTGVYFFPINDRFNAGTIALEDVPAQLSAWLAMHWLRIAFAFLASGFGIVALTR